MGRKDEEGESLEVLGSDGTRQRQRICVRTVDIRDLGWRSG
jgi:hypothetical protein